MTLLPGRQWAPFRLHAAHLLVTGVSIASLMETRPAMATAVEFQSSFMRQSADHASDAGVLALNALTLGNDLGPGRYEVDIQVNRLYFGRRELEFVLSPTGDQLQPCLSADLLSEMGVRVEDLYQPYWIEGKMQVRASSSELADAGYQMEAEKIYAYELR